MTAVGGYGYGFQFWLNPPGGFRADGAFGQYSMILPKQDAVVAITSESIATKTTMQIVWDTLLPEMKSASPLPKDRAAYNLLKQQLGVLGYEPPKQATASPVAATIAGKDFLLEQNPFNAKAVSFRFNNDTCILP